MASENNEMVETREATTVERDGRVYTFEDPIEYFVSGDVIQHQTYGGEDSHVSTVGSRRRGTNREEREFDNIIEFIRSRDKGCAYRASKHFKKRKLRIKSNKKGEMSWA